jgi:hypothetical protein
MQSLPPSSEQSDIDVSKQKHAVTLGTSMLTLTLPGAGRNPRLSSLLAAASVVEDAGAAPPSTGAQEPKGSALERPAIVVGVLSSNGRN